MNRKITCLYHLEKCEALALLLLKKENDRNKKTRAVIKRENKNEKISFFLKNEEVEVERERSNMPLRKVRTRGNLLVVFSTVIQCVAIL